MKANDYIKDLRDRLRAETQRADQAEKLLAEVLQEFNDVQHPVIGAIERHFEKEVSSDTAK